MVVVGVNDYYNTVSAALAAIVAWNFFVSTLEVNSFRLRLKQAYVQPSSASSQPSTKRYIASLVATRLGLRDAVIDWSAIYVILYAIIGGTTYFDADPDSLFVLRGLNAMISALIVGIASLKILQWLGLYRTSKFQIIQDSSNIAPTAVHNLLSGSSSPDTAAGDDDEKQDEPNKSTLSTYRYQVRLAVGKHFAKFTILLLPFYVALRVEYFVASIVIGLVGGHLFLYSVYKCRQTFDNSGKIAIGASAFLSLGGGALFGWGLILWGESWQWNTPKGVIFIASFFSFQAVMTIFHGITYWEHIQYGKAAAEEDGGAGPNTSAEEEAVKDAKDERGEVLIIDELGESQGYFYDTQYFDTGALEIVGVKDGTSEDDVEDINNVTPVEIFNSAVAIEESSRSDKWYHDLWRLLPFQPVWDLSTMVCKSNCAGCCSKDTDAKVKKNSLCVKVWTALVKIIAFIINCLALYVTIVACGATLQIQVTKSKMPFVYETLYKHMNDGPVCAFNEKCGDIRTFDNAASAALSNYTIAACGPCGHCSSWNDLHLQYSTRHSLAAQSQECGVKTMFSGVDALSSCLHEEIGFTEKCAGCWATDIYCSKAHCIFIYLQSRMTNQLGNFAVGENKITAASCEESNCEAGNPGTFVGEHLLCLCLF
mmetsp:Transcript_12346/g.18365  ORF Transcript_12346/g.18365 Transcript_12346/m.18365 type:complete len:652 (+) Transcript_12346:84-2039(+)